MVPQMGKPRLQEVLLGLTLRVGVGYGTSRQEGALGLHRACGQEVTECCGQIMQ